MDGWYAWRGCQARRAVIGRDFAEVLAAAQEGDELAFSRLWRDGNPALLRYLRVMAPEFAEDAAAETWLGPLAGPSRCPPRPG
jgi:RNA polymerase sigma-70 factor (ECF subfamily)